MEQKEVIKKCYDFWVKVNKNTELLKGFIGGQLPYSEYFILEGKYSEDKAEILVEMWESQGVKQDINLDYPPKIEKEPFEVPPSTLVEADRGIRTFATGANRNSDEGKLDYEGFLSPQVLEKYAEYMHKHRHLEDGSLRDSDNWQKGIPQEAYMKSMWRHFMDVWKNHRGIETEEDEITNLCAVLFNVSGMLHEKLKEQ